MPIPISHRSLSLPTHTAAVTRSTRSQPTSREADLAYLRRLGPKALAAYERGLKGSRLAASTATPKLGPSIFTLSADERQRMQREEPARLEKMHACATDDARALVTRDGPNAPKGAHDQLRGADPIAYELALAAWHRASGPEAA